MGQGLAGSVLALQLIEKGFTVKVIDEPSQSNCSKIAAGIWNPVVFKRLTKSWMADEVIPEMLSFFRKYEALWNTSLLTERKIVKLFSEQQEIDLWLKKSSDELKDILDPTIYYTRNYRNIHTGDLGYSKVIKAGNLDVKLFLDLTREELRTRNSYVEENFDYTRLKFSENISYKDLGAKGIIFAEGHKIRFNPWFKYIPMKPARGEIIGLEVPDLKTGSDIINKNSFLMENKPREFVFGATYDWANLSDTVTQEGIAELEQKLKKIVSCSYKVTSLKAGVRPSVIDRRPVIGTHPVYRNLHVFNGMGTKGVMLSPWFAASLVSFLQKKSALIPESDVARFNKFFVN